MSGFYRRDEMSYLCTIALQLFKLLVAIDMKCKLKIMDIEGFYGILEDILITFLMMK